MSKLPGADILTLKTYVIGYVLSLYITITAYLMVRHHLFTKDTLIAAAAGLALIQFIVQALFFLHLGHETKPRWKATVFLFMIGVVIILVAGSIWIMTNLDYHMSPQQVQQYLKSQDAL